MKKIITIVLVAVTLSISMFSISAFAAESSKIVYKNDFDGVGIDETMDYNPYGTPSIQEEKGNKYLKCEISDDDRIAFRINFGPDEQKNVDITLKMRMQGSSDKNHRMAVFFRSPTIPAFEAISYQLRLYELRSVLTFADIYDANNQTYTQIAEYSEKGNKSGLWHNVKISLRENRIVAYIDGNMVCDTTHDGYAALGGFGLCSYGMSFDVDDIVITRHYGTVLPEPTANEVPEWVGDPLDEEEPEFEDTGDERLNLVGAFNDDDDVDVKISNLSLNKYIVLATSVSAVLLLAGIIVFIILLVREKKKEVNIKF